MSDKNTPNITNKEYQEIYRNMSKDRLIELLIADKRELRRLRGMWLEQKQANEANKQPDTKALHLHGVSGSACPDCGEQNSIFRTAATDTYYKEWKECQECLRVFDKMEVVK